MGLPLSPQVFAITSALIEEKTGIRHESGDRDLLGEKLSQRALERGFDSLLDYYYSLRYDADAEAELKALVETLVVQETYFFRESEALEALVDVVLVDRLAEAERTGRKVRIWSAACATGEEPLTLAMILEHRGLLDRVELVASDISVRGIERAREGRFGGRALRAFPVDMRTAYTSPLPGGRVLVSPDLLQGIQWRHVNLIEPSAVAEIGSVDAIICRNVLIYFGDDSCRQVATSLGEALAPDGVLLVGASESLLRFGIFDCEERGGSFFYRRPPA
jgi:chemotaxis protein methyltransferase CheR